MKELIEIALWILLVGGIILFYFIRRSRNLKKAKSNEDKELIRKSMQSFFNEADCSLVYAHYEEQESYGRTVRTTFFRYVVIFFEKTLQVFPVRIDRKTREVQVAVPMILNPDNLGKITVDVKRKNDLLKYAEIWLGDKQGHCIVQFRIDAVNLRKNKWFPVNLIQQEECEEFAKFITDLSQTVAKENPKVDLIMANEANATLGTLGICLSIIGAVGGIFFPPLGLILCLIGFALSLAGKLKGNANKKSFIACTVLMIWSILFCVFYFTIMFA